MDNTTIKKNLEGACTASISHIEDLEKQNKENSSRIKKLNKSLRLVRENRNKLRSEIRWGKKVKLIKYVQIRPKDIIKPKSITGFIPLVYRVAKAKIVVRAEYKHGLYIFCKHNVMEE